jgi:hypothetical protein
VVCLIVRTVGCALVVIKEEFEDRYKRGNRYPYNKDMYIKIDGICELVKILQKIHGSYNNKSISTRTYYYTEFSRCVYQNE